MVFRLNRKVLRSNVMPTASAAICRIPNARSLIPAVLGVAERTVDGWLQGTSAPSWDNTIALIKHFDEFADAVLQETGRANPTISHEQRRKLLQLIGEP